MTDSTAEIRRDVSATIGHVAALVEQLAREVEQQLQERKDALAHGEGPSQ